MAEQLFDFASQISSMNPIGFLDAPTENLASTVGLTTDLMKFLIALLLTFPLSFIFKCLPPSTALKHQFSFFCGFTICWYQFGFQTLNLVFTAMVVYAIAGMFVRQSWMPQAVFAFTLIYMSVCHIWRQITNFGGYDMDFTGPQMILTLKLSAFGFNVYDGYKSKKDDAELSEDQVCFQI
jgi:hypothetical protein